MPKKKRKDIVQEVLNDYYEDKGAHDVFVEKADRCYRAYRGLLEERSEAAQWTNKQHPAYVLQSIETMVANLLMPSPKWRLRALPVLGNPEEIERARAGARANELLLSHQLTLDNYAQKQRIFDLQALITGLTASKQFWQYQEGPRRRQEFYEQPSLDLWGNPVGGSQIMAQLVEETQVLRDDPSFEVIDVRHFLPHQGAVSLAQCDRVTHRVFYSYEKLQDLVAQGIYGPQAGGESIDELRETRGNAHEHFARENELFQTQPHKDDIEILEQWREGGQRVVTIANQSVLLADKANPYWFDHLEHPYPFVVCSGMPDLFRIPGISEVELMRELQEMLWTLINQRLDNLQLINNAIFLIAEHVEDPDALEFAPGEKWLLPPPLKENVQPWSPDPQVAALSLEAEKMLKGDVQNITGGMPFLSGTESATSDQKTATGVSIITSLAQKRLAAKQQQFVWAKSRIGEHWCALNQQFITSSRLVPVVGSDGVEAFEEIRPDLIQGRYLFETEIVDESLMRQERRAEATAKFQIAVQSQGVMAVSRTPLNLRAFMDDVLDSYDISDKERYYTEIPPQAMQPQQGGVSTQPQNGGAGVTNPQLAAGMSAPSNPLSMSPERFLQRLGAMRGGPANVSG